MGPIPRRVSPSDDGSAFTMPVNTTATLQIHSTDYANPTVTGESVLLIPMVNVAPGGPAEWEIRAVAPGTSTVHGTSPRFTFTITVP
ncbi:MAG TPA: hypothetical protein VK045_12910 [Ornithinicoccus sp.]|nr:hypothetical protein [Ornithinicoccus sp.]